MGRRKRNIKRRVSLKRQVDLKVTFKPRKGRSCNAISYRIAYNRRNAPCSSSDYGSRSLLPKNNETRTSNARDIYSRVHKDYHSDEIKRQQRTIVRDTLPWRPIHDVASGSSELSSTSRQHSNNYNRTHSEHQSGTHSVYQLPARMSHHQGASFAPDHFAIHKSASSSDRNNQRKSITGHPDDLTNNITLPLAKRQMETNSWLEGTLRKKPRVPDDFKLRSRKRRLSIDEGRSSAIESIKKQKYESVITMPIGYKRLEEISQETDPDKVVMQLTAESERFTSLLQSDEIRLDLVRLLIRTLSKVQASSHLFVSANHFLSSAWQKNGGFLISHLSPFISAIPENLSRFDNVSELLKETADVLSAMLSRFDKMIFHNISPVILQLKETFEKLQHQGSIQGKEVGERIEGLLSLKEAVARTLGKGDGVKSTETPPDDFRTLEIMPQSGDFHCYKKPFLRENIVDGAYANLDHYLDVQFRLLREDFIIPLRDCIKEIVNSAIHPREFEVAVEGYCETQSKKIRKTNYSQIYHEVMVLNPVCSKKKMVYRIRFDAQHRSVRNIKWNRASKRLKYGSLVCLSSDNFETLHVATVENRDVDGLQVGELEVRFEYDNAKDVNHYIRHKEKFDMVESPTFFEAYRHVLKALQKLDNESLPFQQYIVDCDQDVRAPAYLTQGDEEGNIPVYDLTAISSSTFIGAEFVLGQQSVT